MTGWLKAALGGKDIVNVSRLKPYFERDRGDGDGVHPNSSSSSPVLQPSHSATDSASSSNTSVCVVNQATHDETPVNDVINDSCSVDDAASDVVRDAPSDSDQDVYFSASEEVSEDSEAPDVKNPTSSRHRSQRP